MTLYRKLGKDTDGGLVTRGSWTYRIEVQGVGSRGDGGVDGEGSECSAINVLVGDT